ncbi:hypothetical protein PI124_g22307 [Phytophthora idaei]|nr:hypothetical protein PI126_g22144 [Phytophthora idaei]KAG3232615.1 hypothetical protein PI124_g22307 [Phytophthora idaei]
MTHSASYWQVRCIEDTSSEDENTPPKQQRDGYQGRANRLKVEDVESDSGTATPPGLSPQRAKGVRLPKAKPEEPHHVVAGVAGDASNIPASLTPKTTASRTPPIATSSSVYRRPVLSTACHASWSSVTVRQPKRRHKN